MHRSLSLPLPSPLSPLNMTPSNPPSDTPLSCSNQGGPYDCHVNLCVFCFPKPLPSPCLCVSCLRAGRKIYVEKDDFRAKKMARKAGGLIIFCVDASGT